MFVIYVLNFLARALRFYFDLALVCYVLGGIFMLDWRCNFSVILFVAVSCSNGLP